MKTKFRKSTLLLIGTLLLVSTLNAQHHRNDRCRERKHQDSTCQYDGRNYGARNLHDKLRPKKVGYITGELQLTTEEAEKFWPIYNEYEEEMMSIRDKYRPKDTTRNRLPKRPDFLSMSDKEAQDMLADHFKVQKEMIALKEKYSEEMKKAIPTQKVIMFFHAEKRFISDVIGQNHKKNHLKHRPRR